MTGKEEQTELHKAELEKYRTLLLAILDYHLEHYTGSMVSDQWDPSAEHYLKQKEKAEMDFQYGRLDELQQAFGRLVKGLCNRGDIGFERHLKEKTAYDISSIDDLCKNTDAIDVQNENGMEPLIPKCIVVAEVDDRGIQVVDMNDIEQYLSTRPFEFNFPDCIRRVTVQTNGTDEKAITEVCIGLKGGFGCIYVVNGESLPVKAYWKDKSTVVIETKDDYPVLIRHDQVSSFKDVVKIEYIKD